MGHGLPSVTAILRTTRIQSLASAEVSLRPRSTSVTWSGRRQKWMSSRDAATWCQMNEQLSSEALEDACICVHKYGVQICDKEGFSLLSAASPLPRHPYHQDVVLCWTELTGSGQLCGVPLEDRRASG
ncbi:Hypothetical predicted protein [Lynx pardinus]|uniref:Uncharacterized protein n=1 Tax=Lynx pardinus TaxID=191816 RepID=A0A485MHL6_LYNPA|nr:Hypothetical predicted protein [Lynx pardinus]